MMMKSWEKRNPHPLISNEHIVGMANLPFVLSLAVPAESGSAIINILKKCVWDLLLKKDETT